MFAKTIGKCFKNKSRNVTVQRTEIWARRKWPKWSKRKWKKRKRRNGRSECRDSWNVAIALFVIEFHAMSSCRYRQNNRKNHYASAETRRMREQRSSIRSHGWHDQILSILHDSITVTVDLTVFWYKVLVEWLRSNKRVEQRQKQQLIASQIEWREEQFRVAWEKSRKKHFKIERKFCVVKSFRLVDV